MVKSHGQGQKTKAHADLKLSGLLSSLKLPQDSLSRSIIAFARFFSLPLEPKLLASIRRDALGAKQGVGREASALGAAAATDKGIKLGEKALGEYATAIEGSLKSFIREEQGHSPVQPENHDSEDPQDQDSPAGDGSEDNKNNGSLRDNRHRDQKKKNPSSLNDVPPAANNKEIQGHILDILQKRPLLDLINRIPGKNGQWIVVPFSFCENGYEFSVALRIFIHVDSLLSVAGSLVFERLYADIKVTRLDWEQRHWLVLLENTGRDKRAELSVSSSSGPWNFSPWEKKRVRQELAAALGIPFDKVSIVEAPPLFADSRDDILSSVDEEV
jgi:hypothetical protein